MAKSQSSAADQQARQLLQTLDAAAGSFRSSRDLASKPAAKAISEADPAVRSAVVLLAVRDVGALRPKITSGDPPAFFNLHHVPGYSYSAVHIVGPLLARDLPLGGDDIAEILREIARFDHIAALSMPFLAPLLTFLEQRRGGTVPAKAKRDAQKIAAALLTMEGAEENRLSKRFAALAKGNGSVNSAATMAKASAGKKPAKTVAKKSATKTRTTKKSRAAKPKPAAKESRRAT